MKGIWIAFGIGVTAGAAVALLYAPQSGTATRKKLRRGIADASDRLEDAGDFIRVQAEKLTGEAQDFVKQTRKQMEEIVDSAGELVSGAVKTAKAVKTLM